MQSALAIPLAMIWISIGTLALQVMGTAPLRRYLSRMPDVFLGKSTLCGLRGISVRQMRTLMKPRPRLLGDSYQYRKEVT